HEVLPGAGRGAGAQSRMDDEGEERAVERLARLLFRPRLHHRHRSGRRGEGAGVEVANGRNQRVEGLEGPEPVLDGTRIVAEPALVRADGHVAAARGKEGAGGHDRILACVVAGTSVSRAAIRPEMATAAAPEGGPPFPYLKRALQ